MVQLAIIINIRFKRGTRNSPSRQCCRIRRAAARKKVAKEAEIQAENGTAEANENEMNQNDEEEASEITEQVVDEFCPNSEYEKDD